MQEQLLNNLRETLSRMELALGLIDDAIVWLNEVGNIEWCNKAFDILVGLSHIEILGKDIAKFMVLTKDDQQISWREKFNQAKRNLTYEKGELFEFQRNKQKFFLTINIRALVKKENLTFVAVLKDVTTEQNYLNNILSKDKLLKHQSDLLSKEKAYVDNIISSMSNMLIVVDQKGTVKTVNQAASLMLGYDNKELIGKKLQDVLVSSNHILDDIISLKTLANIEVNCKTKTGQVKPTLLSGSVMFDPDGQIAAIVTIAQDISERKEMENRLLYLSTHDSLTGLPNRAFFEDVFEKAIQRAMRVSKSLALLYIDLDKFKHVNDSLGHRVGDLLLVAVGERINRSIRKDDIAVRIGGDEFAVILNGLNSKQEAGKIAEKLLNNIKSNYMLDNLLVKMTTSIGIAFFNPDDSITTSGLRRNADIAMYKAKARGGDNYQYYD